MDIRRLEHDRLELDFRQKAIARALTVQQQFEHATQSVLTFSRLLADFPDAGREQFDKFAESLLHRRPYIRAFLYQRTGISREPLAYTFATGNGPKDRTVSSFRLEGQDTNDAQRRAIDTGQAIAMGTLKGSDGHGSSMLLVMPLYRKGVPLDMVADRRKAALGAAIAVLDAEAMIERALSKRALPDDGAFDISVYVGDAVDEHRLAFRRAAPPAPLALPLPGWLRDEQLAPVVHEFSVASASWNIVMSLHPATFAHHHSGSLFIAAGGLLFSLLLAAFTQTFSWRSLRVRQLVAERTAELEFKASRDPLTGLANRNLLRDRLYQANAFAHRYGKSVWILFINLDRFKFVNDTLGHPAGDQLLVTVAQRLERVVRQTDTVARLSADEFVLVLPERTEEHLVPTVIQRVMAAISQPIILEGYEFVMSSSIGVAVCPSDGTDADSLIKHAGIAMYRAKELGSNNFQFYMPAMNERAMERLRMEGDLRNALERNEFVLHFQPQVALGSGQITGMETLLRWQHPELGMVTPGRFIELAEEMGLIVPIGLWVLHAACRQSVEWQAAGMGELRVAVNLSARQFYQHDLVASIRSILDETGLAPHLLELELTESMMMNDVEHAVAIMHNLKVLGVQLSIDDFGTGYSSLAYLKRFPIDLLKIDKSFVRDLTVDTDDAAIVLSIISLAHSLRLKVVAEGVETAAQLAYLQRHHCDYMQGYYFSRPLSVLEAEHLLRRGKTLPLHCGAGASASELQLLA